MGRLPKPRWIIGLTNELTVGYGVIRACTNGDGTPAETYALVAVFRSRKTAEWYAKTLVNSRVIRVGYTFPNANNWAKGVDIGCWPSASPATPGSGEPPTNPV